jgi:hypothetical protein
MPTLLNSIQSDAPFPKYSTVNFRENFCICGNIFVFMRKFSYFRENFRKNFAKMRRWNFCFGPNVNWILTLPNICLFILLKWGKKLHHMYQACRINVKFKAFSRKFSRNFREIFAKIFAWFSHFRENWKMHFRFNTSIY